MYEFLHKEIELSTGDPFVEAEARGRGRAPVRKTTKQLTQEARQAQRDCGVVIYIARKVLNEPDFDPIFELWTKYPQRSGQKELNMLRNRQPHETVFDSKSMLSFSPRSWEQEELDEELRRRKPALFERIGPVAVSGVAEFGNSGKPWIGLDFKHGSKLHADQDSVLDVVAPSRLIDTSIGVPTRPHVSLVQVLTENETRREFLVDQLRSEIDSIRPRYVELGPAQVTVKPIEDLPQQNGRRY